MSASRFALTGETFFTRSDGPYVPVTIHTGWVTGAARVNVVVLASPAFFVSSGNEKRAALSDFEGAAVIAQPLDSGDMAGSGKTFVSSPTAAGMSPNGSNVHSWKLSIPSGNGGGVLTVRAQAL